MSQNVRENGIVVEVKEVGHPGDRRVEEIDVTEQFYRLAVWLPHMMISCVVMHPKPK